ncbi:Bacterial type II secretion system protein F domain protein [Rubripirellula amarantea]|uniref:Bacterial type II secretion system protein F domain protein n=1 Tax=Rubripirellula amarantea TaxID=2527999 RepID=A0A5C5WSZ0_9BACT|nr:type II secretion system F family protein [Rubripirellula amarantea]TWT54044.1 Bacterial type II secretion system protein F domain protein [Rubripirellula amarantea]
MPGLVIALVIGVFVASLIAFAAHVLIPDSETSATEDRLSQMASRRRGGSQPESEQSSLMRASSIDDSDMLGKMLNKLPALSEYLEQADMQINPAKFGMICVAFFGFGIFACVVTPVPVILGPFLGIALAGLPVGYVMFKRKKRLHKFGLQMPEAMELLSRSLRAGHSLNAGFGLVASEMDNPLAAEFGRAFEEQNLGIPLDEAIEDMASRIPNMDLRFFATAIVLQRQTGGDLAEILDKIGKLVRERLAILGQIQALTGEGRMSGVVLLGMPPTLFLVMLKMNYEYVVLLFTDPLGKIMLSIALVTQIIGAIVIKKIITIKV